MSVRIGLGLGPILKLLFSKVTPVGHVVVVVFCFLFFVFVFFVFVFVLFCFFCFVLFCFVLFFFFFCCFFFRFFDFHQIFHRLYRIFGIHFFSNKCNSIACTTEQWWRQGGIGAFSPIFLKKNQHIFLPQVCLPPKKYHFNCVNISPNLTISA